MWGGGGSKPQDKQHTSQGQRCKPKRRGGAWSQKLHGILFVNPTSAVLAEGLSIPALISFCSQKKKARTRRAVPGRVSPGRGPNEQTTTGAVYREGDTKQPAIREEHVMNDCDAVVDIRRVIEGRIT